MTSTLQLRFLDTAGRSMTISLLDPRENLTPAEVQQAMQTIIEKDVFASPRGSLAQIDSAQIVTREVTEIELV